MFFYSFFIVFKKSTRRRNTRPRNTVETFLSISYAGIIRIRFSGIISAGGNDSAGTPY